MSARTTHTPSPTTRSPEPKPIACSLGPADLAARLERARGLGERALAAVEVSSRTAKLTFAGAERDVREFAACERRCCEFLEVSVHPRGGRTELRIGAPEGGEPSMRSIVAALVAGWEGGL